MKFCKDCIHYSAPSIATTEKCWAPQNLKVDLVCGDSQPHRRPNVMRNLEASESCCGSEGAWWTPNPKKIATFVPPHLNKPWYKFWSR